MVAVKAFFYSLVILMAAAQSAAESRLDSRIDEAAREILAAKMGDLRGGFRPGEEPLLVSRETALQQKTREPLKVLQYGRYREEAPAAPQSTKAR